MSVQAIARGVALTWLIGFAGFVSTALAQSAVPPPWADSDIGSPSLAGSSSTTSNVFTIDAGGVDIWGTSDQFHFVYQQVTGDVDVRARVDNITYASSWAKAGLMIRSSLAATAAHGFALVSAGKGMAFQRRTTDAGISTNTAGPFLTAPQWVRLVRSGSDLTAYASEDGAAWTIIGTDTVQLGATAYVGIAVTSHNASATTTASVSNVRVVQPQAVALPAGQADSDIGSPTIEGSASYGSGQYTITGSGADIWGTADQFHYVYQQASGDVDVKVRVSSVTYADRWSKAGVMIRESLSADSAHGYALVSAGRGYAFQRRLLAGDISASTAGSTGTPPGWLRLRRTGNLLTAYESTDGTNWTAIGSDSIALPDLVYVGIAVTSHSTAAATTVVADNFTVTTVQAPGNQVPSVSLSASGGPYTAPATVSLTATASDPENQMDRVEFYNGTTLLGTDTTAPYTFSWTNVPAGTYSLTATAYDGAGQSAQSTPVTLTVAAANQAPSVSLTAPANGATYTAPASITITANASDPENQLSRVDFYNGTTLLGSATTAPYSFTWSNVSAGTYTLSAIARDAGGLTAQSGTVNVTVAAANQAPSVSLTAPANGASLTAPASITITANASDPENQLSRVDFYNGTTLLGSDTTVPYSFTWSNVPAGTYSLNAVARDSAGLSTQSVSVSVTVTAATAPPTGVIFQASVDHATVTSYRVEVFAAGADPSTATAIATTDVGKPTPDANNDISVSIPSFFSALAPGNYVLTVAALNGTQFTRSSPPVAFTK